MNRRSLIGSAAGATLASALANAQSPASARKTALYRLDYLYLRQGAQGDRVNQFLSSQMPLFLRHSRTAGVFNMLVGPYTPATVVLTCFSGFEDMEAFDDRLRKDAGYQKALEQMEKGEEPPFDRADRVLLRPTGYSPEISPISEKPKMARYFELRVYHSPTDRQLRFLHERFAGPESKIFHRSGIHPILYAETMIGPNMPNLTYLTPFGSLAEREKAWDAFAADPEWVKVRAESIQRGGQIVAHNSIVLLRPAPFSPIQ